MNIPINEHTLAERTARQNAKAAAAQSAVATAVAAAQIKAKSPEDEGIVALSRGMAARIALELDQQGRRLILAETEYQKQGRVTLSAECLVEIAQIAELALAMKHFISFQEMDNAKIQVPRQ